MLPSNEVWSNTIASILGGGFAGAAVIGLLFKFLIQNQLEKSLKQYQHDLDAKKEILQTELTVHAEHAKFKITDHRKKSIAALESVYSGLVRTALPRHGFKSKSVLLNFNLLAGDEAIAEYFRMYSANFVAFKLALDSVTTGFSCLEESAIYLDAELEKEVATALADVNSCYQKWHMNLQTSHETAQTLVRKGALTAEKMTMNFDQFYAQMAADWIAITTPTKVALKSKLRLILEPK